jgi:hypothetical protein
MNPSRPDPVPLEKAKELLNKTYYSMLNAFWKLKNGEEYRPTTTKMEKAQDNSACRKKFTI